MNGHLVLVGLMGAGKTTIGRWCAERLDRAFVDTDELVEVAAGMSVAEIFATEGESTFRTRERHAVADACASPVPVVIACGGGAVVDADNRRRLRRSGCVVWLQADPRTLAQRTGSGSGTTGRPLLRGGDAVAVLERLARVRDPSYRAAAHVVVVTDGRDRSEVADEVIEAFERCDG